MGKEIFINFFQFKERRCLVFNKKPYILVTLFTCLFLGFLYLLCLWQLMQVHVFGHDDLYYLSDSEYLWTITMEGRYINYLLFPLVRLLPQKFAIIITCVAFFLFFWTCAVGIGTKKAALAVAIASLLSCPLFILLQFPGTPLASYVALAFFAIYKLVYPRCDYRKFLFIAGIVFCGLYNQFYNFIPLLFLGSVLHNRIKLLHLLCWYVVCFVIGFFISEMVCYLYSGHFIEVAPWRNPQYVHSFSDLIRNIRLEYNAFWADLRIAGKWPWVWAFLCLPAALVLCFRHDYKKLSGLVKCFCVLLCVMLAAYIQALPFGLGTTAGGRTSGPLYAGLILIPFLAFQKKIILMLFSLLLISTPMFITDYKSLDYLKTVGDIYYNNLKKIGIDPALYSVVFIDIDNTAKNIEKKISKINNFNRYSLSVHIDLRAAANAVGFKTVIFNYNNIPEIKEKIQDSKKEWRQNDFYRYCVTGDLLLVKVAWPD